ncbi:MAG: hypothetical protein R2762_07785 [Bryobacteraceae bacterium]
MPRSTAGEPVPSAVLVALVEAFIASARDPVLVEPGEEPYLLVRDCYILDETTARIQLWDERRHLNRKLRRIVGQRAGTLEIEVERFGKRTGSVLLIDRARAPEHTTDRRAARLALREQLRRCLRRQFPDWKITELTAEAFLEQSLSPVYPRAMICRSGRALAALAAPADPAAAAHALSFGLVWLDYLRRRERSLLLDGLCLLLPAGGELDTCLRIRWLHPEAARFCVFVYDSPDGEVAVDPAIHGNLDTELVPPPSKTPAKDDQREAWLEACIRRDPRAIHAQLRPGQLYGQVTTWAAADRGILDLLAIDGSGRLSILELKAAADLHLPLQALDYWLRVRWHQQEGDLGRLGYFGGDAVAPQPPRLMLVAPALAFHPTTETIIRYFSPQIEVERVGLHVEWFQEFRVMFRLPGSQPAR